MHVLAVVVALAGVSSSAPLILVIAAPALAIAFWRNALGAAALAPVALVGRRSELATVVRHRQLTLCVLAGVALAAHFGTWVPSVRLTSVAASAALVATQPVWQGLIALAQGRRLATATWVGIGLAVAGAGLATGADLRVSAQALAGDLLALAGGVAGAAYTALGERARVSMTTTTYATICYTVCAAVLAAVCLAGGVPLAGFDARSWLGIGALTVGAQMLGHTLFNYALRRISATTLSVLVLLEVPGAALIAWGWLGQVPPAGSLPGIALLLAGVLVVVTGWRPQRSAGSPTARRLAAQSRAASSGSLARRDGRRNRRST